jgi:uncharacterized protein with HEPN domain
MCQNHSAAVLAQTTLQRDAVLFQIAVIGEAVSHLPADVQALAPEIPWVGVIVLTVATRLDLLIAVSQRSIDLIGHE